jgi:SAM-dependent methyltransferase
MSRPDLYAPDSMYHRNRRWTHPHSVRCLETAMDVLGTPQSLLDVGCAEGVLVQWAQRRGIDAMGIDLAAPVGDPAFLRADLRGHIDIRRQFDWVTCWEVAEHLPESSAERLVETLVHHMSPMGRIVFTAAGPKQPGPGHINCQPAGYWHGLFADLGLTYVAGLSSVLRRKWLMCSPKTPWYGLNAAVYWRQA